MNDTYYIAATVIIMAVVTMLLRFLPFVIFSGKKTPSYIIFLGKYLPYSIMGMLVVYCLRNTVLSAAPFGIPEIISVVLVAALHIWKRNTLLSILAGTACYMVLTRLLA